MKFVKREKFIIIKPQLLFFLRAVTVKVVRNLPGNLRNICYDFFQVPTVGVAYCGDIKRFCSVYAAETGTGSSVYSSLMIQALQIFQFFQYFFFWCICCICTNDDTKLFIRTVNFCFHPLTDTASVIIGKFGRQTKFLIAGCKNQIFACKIQIRGYSR